MFNVLRRAFRSWRSINRNRMKVSSLQPAHLLAHSNKRERTGQRNLPHHCSELLWVKLLIPEHQYPDKCSALVMETGAFGYSPQTLNTQNPSGPFCESPDTFRTLCLFCSENKQTNVKRTSKPYQKLS